jgi:hypothetical protein
MMVKANVKNIDVTVNSNIEYMNSIKYINDPDCQDYCPGGYNRGELEGIHAREAEIENHIDSIYNVIRFDDTLMNNDIYVYHGPLNSDPIIILGRRDPSYKDILEGTPDEGEELSDWIAYKFDGFNLHADEVADLIKAHLNTTYPVEPGVVNYASINIYIVD